MDRTSPAVASKKGMMLRRTPSYNHRETSPVYNPNDGLFKTIKIGLYRRRSEKFDFLFVYLAKP